MRILQVVIFALGVLSFVAAVLFVGQEMGDVLWRVGVAALLVDLLCIKLWPSTKSA